MIERKDWPDGCFCIRTIVAPAEYSTSLKRPAKHTLSSSSAPVGETDVSTEPSTPRGIWRQLLVCGIAILVPATVLALVAVAGIFSLLPSMWSIGLLILGMGGLAAGTVFALRRAKEICAPLQQLTEKI